MESLTYKACWHFRPWSRGREFYAIASLVIFYTVIHKDLGEWKLNRLKVMVMLTERLQDVFVWPSENRRSGSSDHQKKPGYY